MATNKMLIDATHPEETRVVVLRNSRVEEFDYESAARKLLRGNIYLAKVTRVEPSLQAGFIDYGGNRHGFLAFNEIHPDYYQIPMADRQALLDEEAAAEAEEEAAADARAERLARRQQRHGGAPQAVDSDAERQGGEGSVEFVDTRAGADDEEDDDAEDDHDEAVAEVETLDPDEAPRAEAIPAASSRDEVLVEDLPVAAEPIEVEVVEIAPPAADEAPHASSADVANDDGDDADDDGPEMAEAAEPAGAGVPEVVAVPAVVEAVEQTGAEDALEELPSRPRRRPRSYKIQEVIKRRQVILVQVVKEERGNKGAALTTYLSLAGRYTVLMPNTARGGGISRKITQPQDRKRLKAIAAELEVPEGMGLIIRTAGAARTKQEIKRDFEYLLRLWESVRDLTLQSTAPSLVYEEGNLIKRSIRDLYNKDVEEIVVAGQVAHHDARDFMRMLMPSHAKHVVQHDDSEPLFTKYGIERQLNAMFSPYVTLKSGGYLVINQTEALVAIDVNSGKATREFSIEETALNTNLEASDEIARQLKLRDLAGLIVIDFIDMEEKRNNRAVERRLKDALRFDRARIQLGRISHFGLMEMSRQRLRTGVLEGSTSQCPHCQGTGIIRSTESVALAVLRGLEDQLMAGARTSLVATTTSSVALYLLNNKRQFINEMEARHGLFITVQASEKLQGANFTIEKGQAAPVAARRPERQVVNMDWGFEGEDAAEAVDDEPVEAAVVARDGDDNRRDGDEGGKEGGRRRRRRRGRRGSNGDEQRADRPRGEERASPAWNDNDDEGPEDVAAEPAGLSDEPAQGDEQAAEGEGGAAGARGPGGERRRRRGRRGGRRGRGRERNGAESREHDGAGEHNEAEPREYSADTTDADVDGGEGAYAPPLAAAAPDADFAEPGEADARQPAPTASLEVPAAPEPEPARSPELATIAVDGPADEPPVPAAAVPEPAPEAETGRRRTRQLASVTSEPKIERVLVTPEQVEPVEPTEAAPVRRGWWQRRT